MAASFEDTIDELSVLISEKKLKEVSVFLRENSKQLEWENNEALLEFEEKWAHLEKMRRNSDNSFLFEATDRNLANSILEWLIKTLNTNDDKPVLHALWEMQAIEYDNRLQWLPQEILEDTIKLLPFYRFHRLFKSLLECGADVNAQNGFLHTAVKEHNKLMVRLLLENGAYVTLQDCIGDTPINTAVLYSQVSMARLLLEYGADANQSDELGRTLLFDAAANDDEPMVKLLLDHGANVDAKNKKGQTPRDIAKKLGNKSIVALLPKSSASSHSFNLPFFGSFRSHSKKEQPSATPSSTNNPKDKPTPPGKRP